MHMQIKGWTQFKSLVRWSVVFHHLEGLCLFLLLKSDAMLKDEVPCGGTILNLEQYVCSTHLLREDLWFYNLKKRDFYSDSRIQRPIKRLEKLGLIMAELFSHGILFTVFGVDKSIMVESWLKWKRQVLPRYSLKQTRIFFFARK
ncbi:MULTISPECIES: hypothetical protein [Bacillaceae]|uniref:hypothetical protein n=1 Tax=Bacillaceae TaxID=186817 RepID=UPI00296542FB|nr:hypothetical protein [Bacillus infantis]MDW2876815.1 hypothetical protein [Bacillus infantis]